MLRPAFGVDAGHAHEVQIGANARDGFDRRSADGDDGVLEQSAAEQDDFDRGMLDQRDGDRRAVRDDGGAQVVRQMSRDLQRRRAAIENHDLAALDQLRGRTTDRDFRIGRDLLAAGEIDDRGRGGQGAAVHALQPPGGRQLAQVAADRVFRQLQLAADVLGDDLSLRLQDLEQVILALAGEHAAHYARIFLTLHVFAR